MSRPISVACLVFTVLCLSTLHGQAKPEKPTGAPEFPVVLQESVTAGKTPVGTKVQAKLALATLVNGTVVPRNALFRGEVIDSVAKTNAYPSRLGIRMDFAEWKNGSAAIKVYLTSWYYPVRNIDGQDLQYGPQQPASKTWSGRGQYPDPNSSMNHPFPSNDSDNRDSVPDTPTSVTSNHRVRMKDVQSLRSSEGAIEIASTHSNIKLDKFTTYVLAGDDLVPAK